MKKNLFEIIANFINIVLVIIFIIIIVFGMLLLIQNILLTTDKLSILNSKTFIIISESMQPELYVGDIVLVKEIENEKLEIGDIITYQDRNDKLITHRIIEIPEESREKMYITKGDNNQKKDLEPVYESKIIGKVDEKISIVRNIFSFITNKFVILFMILFYISYFTYEFLEKKKEIKK